MATKATRQLRTIEAAERLGVSIKDVYDLIFAGKLDGRPNTEGLVVVSEDAIADYLERSSPARGADAST